MVKKYDGMANLITEQHAAPNQKRMTVKITSHTNPAMIKGLFIQN